MDDYLAVTDAMEADVDAVEVSVVSEHAGRGDAGRIYQLKRELMELKRAVVPLERALPALADVPSPAIASDVQP